MFWFYQPLAGSIGIDVAYYGFVGAGFNLFAMLLVLNVKKLEDSFGMKNILFYSAFIPSLLFIGLVISKIFILYYLVFC